MLESNFLKFFKILFQNKFNLFKKKGKNYVAQLVAESLFEKGIKSKYFKQFTSTRDFIHSDKINEYRVKNIKILFIKLFRFNYFK
jgi:hypothetical protein